jgi:flagellum-specific ATP synthase
MNISLAKYQQRLEEANPVRVNGKVSQVIGLVLEGHGPGVSIGEVCEVHLKDASGPIDAEVVGFKKGKVLLMPLHSLRGISPGCRIVARGKKADVRVGQKLLGRIIDGLGNPMDGKGPVEYEDVYPLYADPINPLRRGRITEPLDLGVRVINALLTCGKGQRMGIFSGSGVGKSILLSMIARYTKANVNVIGLIGERGREVREFIENNLGEEGLARSVVVVATSDTHPLIRMRAAYMATSISEYFRDLGKDVLLMVDSLTRFAMAQREVGLSIGEPPTTKGYTPSVFSLMPKLLERAGTLEGRGSITGIYTVLVEGGDFDEPIADAARSILDGHITLSRLLAARNHYPAVDVLNSISRVMLDVVGEEHKKRSNDVLNIISTYREAEAYVSGSNPDIDYAIQMIGKINAFLKQGIGERVSFTDSREEMMTLLGKNE